ncbi:solute carrier family 15 member 4-like [Anneissia japonica]|uniref:solute carrier family 15 member 4-like n=1 Tax=Anneissia japonica TaxID=1529436 RepID=UPI0014258E15|nr:solute carrier family 15 member 4-like [Anneissia japonica]XP_033123111.1 solute carrier family 15 member 4-like [Anneissia japonica]
MEVDSERAPLILKKGSVKVEENEDEKEVSIINSGRMKIVLCILCCELCERLTYYSVVANLVVYCTNTLGYTSADAVTVSLVFSGTSYFLPVAGGWVADSISGRFNGIFGGLLIYFIGAAILPVISIDYENLLESGAGLTLNQQRGFYIFALSLIAVGTGGIKSNVGPFGAQQLEDLGEGAIQTFFNWFYWFINVGSAIAYSVVVYIQQEISFAWGYSIPAFSILLATVALLIGRNKYITTPPEGSILSRICKIVWQASSKCCGGTSKDVEVENCLDRAKEENGGSFLSEHVDQVKCLARIVPVFLCIIMYWTIYFQMQTTYILQGERMKLVYNSFTFPVASLSLFNNISLLLLIPILDTVVYPFLERKGYKLTQLKRIGFGMFLASLSMAVAAIVEVARKDIMQDGGYFNQILADKTYNASNLSVFAQIPQYFIVGASEAFTSITGLEFAYSQSPKVLQGVVMGLFLLTSGLGSYVGSLLVIIVNAATKGHEWFPDEVNDGYLEYYYILLSLMMIVNLVIYCFVAHYYTYMQYPSQIPEPLDHDGDVEGDASDKMKMNGTMHRQNKALLVKEGTLSESEI